MGGSVFTGGVFLLRSLAGAVLVALALSLGAPAALAAPATQKEQAAELHRQRKQIGELSDEVSELHTITTVILSPIAFLVGILALGGSLGIVFSIRDQRRVSQLHELTVGGEVLSQRRSEQTYASFFEQSQTTLSLVNDTLELAKEANEQATQGMKRRAQEQVDAIEERAENLTERIFREGDFEKLAYKAENRSELHSIGDELRAVEGFLRLQSIELPSHVKFVKAFNQFLLDDTEAGLQGLRQLDQSDVSGELRRFTLFWLAYMSATVGEYEVAIRIFKADEEGLEGDDFERFQLECIIRETRFFDSAKRLHEADPKRIEDTPLRRLREVAALLDELSALAGEVADSKDSRDLHRVKLEVARTRADIFLWIAYDPERLDKPLGADEVTAAGELPLLAGQQSEAAAFAESQQAASLSPDVLRGWALRHAFSICDDETNLNFDVTFARAESLFMLASTDAEEAFVDAERKLGDEFGDYLENRKKVSLRESELICHSRLLFLRKANEEKRHHEERQVRQSANRAREAVSEMRKGRVTVFSQIQKRNVSTSDLIGEIRAIVAQDHLEDEKK
jgi:hypothetical protein